MVMSIQDLWCTCGRMQPCGDGPDAKAPRGHGTDRADHHFRVQGRRARGVSLSSTITPEALGPSSCTVIAGICIAFS